MKEYLNKLLESKKLTKLLSNIIIILGIIALLLSKAEVVI